MNSNSPAYEDILYFDLHNPTNGMHLGVGTYKTSDQYLTSGKISTRSIQSFRRYRLLKKLTKNLYIKFQSLWPWP